MFPDEALEPLAQRLPVLDVLRLARVCRAWRQQLGRIVLTEQVKIEIYDESKNHHAAAWLARNLHRTRGLELDCWQAPVPPQLLTAAPANGLVRLSFTRWRTRQLPSLATCTALKELQIKDSEHLEELPPLDALTQLTRLEVSGCQLLTAMPPLSSCSALVELRVVENLSLTTLPSLSSCTALEALTVESDQLVDALQLPALTRLTRLELCNCTLDAALPGIDAFPQLRVLGLARCNVESRLLGLTACTGLEELRISDCCPSDDEFRPMYDGAHLPALSALPALRQLCLQGYETGERFPSLAGLTRLTSLEIVACHVEQVEALASLTSLVQLTIAECETLQQLPSLAACEQLRDLTIRICPDLQALPDLSGCTRLENLNFDYCFGLQQPPDLSGCTALRFVTFSSKAARGYPEWFKELCRRDSIITTLNDYDNYDGDCFTVSDSDPDVDYDDEPPSDYFH